MNCNDVELNNITQAAMIGEFEIINVSINKGAYTNPLIIFDLTGSNLFWYFWDIKNINAERYIEKPIKYMINPMIAGRAILSSAGWEMKYEGNASRVNGAEIRVIYLILLLNICQA